MVVVVSFQMLGQVVDSRGENGDLYLRRTCVALMCLIGRNQCLLGFFLHGIHLIQDFAVRLTQYAAGETLVEPLIRIPRERSYAPNILS